jgi:hypothetical protein
MTMSKLITSSKHNPCPVCGKTNGNCRQKPEDPDYWQCMTEAGTRKGVVINGYKCLGDTKDGTWSQFKLDNSAEWTQERRDEWERERRFQQALKAAEDEAKAKQSLTEQERHKQYTALLSELPLHPKDRADLISRGFTTGEIELSGFKSVDNWQKLRGTYSSLLPGIGIGGKRLLTNEGYLCPVRNHNGLIVALQVRLREVKSGEGRYRWLSSVTKKKPDGQSPHIYTKGFTPQLPLAVHEPQGTPKGIALAEGTGTKPFLAAQRLNRIVIGAAGGQHASSPDLLKSALSLCPEIKEIPILADAGSVTNRNVINQYQRTFKLLNSWGITPTIAWWNQVSKNDPDIDELPTERYSEIQYISVEEFETIAREHGGLNPIKHTDKHQTEKRLRQEELRRDDAIYNQLTSITETPWMTINQKEIDPEMFKKLPNRAIYIVTSKMATGKTKALIPMVQDYDWTYSWYERISLGRNSSNKLGLKYKDDQGTGKEKGDAFCSNSAPQYSPNKLRTGGLLIVDESDQCFDHNFGDTCNKDGIRPAILKTLENHISAAVLNGGTAIFLSADNNQKEIDYIRELAPPGIPVRLIVNEYKPPKGEIFSDISSKPDGLIEILLEKLEQGIPCYVIDDIKNGVRGCKSIAEYVRSIHPEWSDSIIEINSDTSGEKNIIDYLRNVNEASKKTSLLCCSPSVTSGLSIENRHFKCVFGFLNGILSVKKGIQSIERSRGDKEIFLWAAEQGLAWQANRATDPKEIKDWYQRNYQQNCKYILSLDSNYNPIIGEWSSPHFELFCKNAAYQNLCMKELRRRLHNRLEDDGYTIIKINTEGSDNTSKGLNQSWRRIEIADALAVANANILSDEEYNKLKDSTETPTPEQQLDIDKTYLLKTFGEELINATTLEHKSGQVLTGYAAMYIKNKRGIYKSQLDNFLLFNSPLEKAVARDRANEKRQLKHEQGRFCGDIRWNARKRKAREFLELQTFLNPDKWFELEDFERLDKKAKSKALDIKDCLNISVEKLAPAQTYTELLAQIGLKTDKEWAEHKPSPDGKRQRLKRRRINPESWKHAQMYVEHQERQKEINTATATIQTFVTEEIVISNSSPSVETQVTKIEELASALQSCQFFQDFKTIVDSVLAEGYSHQDIDDGILFTGNELDRIKLRKWYQDYKGQEQLSPLHHQCHSNTESELDIEPQPEEWHWKEWHWKELPIIGTIVQWVEDWGTAKLTIKAVEPDGRCQLEGLGGMYWNSHIRRVMPVSG